MRFLALRWSWLFAHELFVKFPSSNVIKHFHHKLLFTQHTHIWRCIELQQGWFLECANSFIHSQQLWFLHATRPFCYMTIDEWFAWITFFIHGFNKRFLQISDRMRIHGIRWRCSNNIITLLGGMHPNP